MKEEKQAATFFGKSYVSYFVNPYGDGSKTQIGQKAKIKFFSEVFGKDESGHKLYKCRMEWNEETYLTVGWYYDIDLDWILMPEFMANVDYYGADKYQCFFDPSNLTFEVYDYRTQQSQQVKVMEQQW